MFKKESDSKRGAGVSQRFTALDIERYHHGLMTGAERHALERAALEDPFLEEALEGYASLAPGQAAGDLAALRERLAERVRPHRKRVAWWVAAAAVVVLGGAGIVAYRMSEKAPGAVAMKPVAVTPQAVTLDTAAGVAKPNAVPSGQPLAVERKSRPARKKIATKARALATTKAPATEIDSATVAMATVPAAAPAGNVVAEDALKKLPGVAVDKDGNVVAQGERVTRIRVNGKQFFPASPKTMFQNRVIDYNHQPIPGATLQVGPTDNYVMTDRKGYFRFNAQDSQRVVVTAVGYTSKELYAYQLNDLAAVQLSPDTSRLNEVVVVGYGTSKTGLARKAMGAYHAVTDTNAAQPLEGWSNYNDYISSNLQLPDQAIVNHIHGEVDLTFEVDETGKPVNISVAKSLCDSCDAEAIRLLQQGPGWSKGKKAKGKLKVKF
ncbi:MAG TPA: carboxypeptidase-like regulatory domain-containing protein [Dinghuibacter sp.]|uniref:energy transducer TonB n=1 Tax=Dinghuibacter sp. TaxID=2024697 RepID=UPI002D14B810|nr:carboxypeptidase-like regulatory domain-containing protein [Dinghuibacter sp.]HTJ11176.1 carboxypeptidase-like regulatory domain-containing protein [Dinghuibacter sp.]